MLSRRQWLLVAFLPFVLAILLDQLSKNWALGSIVEPFRLGPLTFQFLKNDGFFLGTFSELSQVYKLVVPATAGGFLLFIFLSVQYFLPFKSTLLRIGFSIFIASVLSNVFDRIGYGYVIDFVSLDLGGLKTGVFNFADALQWVGLVLFVSGYFMSGSLFYPAHQRRGRKWIDPKFQLKYCAILVSSGFGFALVGGCLSYAFLKASIVELSGESIADASQYLEGFLTAYSMTAVAFFFGLFIIGIILSHRIVGPIKGFESFLEDLLSGKARRFQMRNGDEFTQFEGLAQKFYDQFHDKLGIDLPPLASGMHAPDFQAITSKSQKISKSDFLGKKVWMIFYRYATCPICASHLNEIQSLIMDAKRLGVEVILVYESTPEQFHNAKAGQTSQLLASLDVKMIADPERQLYKLYRTRRSLKVFFQLASLKRLLLARRNGFLQDKVDGELGQLPAHILIDANGDVVLTHYGENLNDHIPESTIKAFFVG